VSGRARGRDERERRALLVALVAFLSVTAAVCGGAYRLYEEGALSAVLETNDRRALLLGAQTTTATATESLPTAFPTVTPRSAEPTPAAAAVPVKPAASATPAATATATLVPTPRPTDTLTPTPDPLAGKFSAEYVGCTTPGASAFKGRVYDRDGHIIVGAQVYVTLDGWRYDIAAVTNEAGWYELYLTDGQNVLVDRLVIAGEEQPLAGPTPEPVPVRPDCFQEMNLRQH